MNKKHRIFIAINLPEDIKRELFCYSEKWPDLPAKWTAKDNLHITLEFLGDLTDEEIGEVCKITKEVAKAHPSFSVDLTKVLYGPPKKNSLPAGRQAPRMVWAEGEKSDALADLRNDLQKDLLEEIRFKPESRGFAPHITLARINEWQFKSIELEERPEVNESIDLIFSAESIEVMESILKRGGPVYEILESCELSDNLPK